MPKWYNTSPHTPTVVHCCCTICAVFNIGASKCINLAWSFDYLLGLGYQVFRFCRQIFWFTSLIFKQAKIQIIRGRKRKASMFFFVVMSCWCIKHCWINVNCDPSHYERQQVNIKASWSLTERSSVYVLLCLCTLLVLIQRWMNLVLFC